MYFGWKGCRRQKSYCNTKLYCDRKHGHWAGTRRRCWAGAQAVGGRWALGAGAQAARRVGAGRHGARGVQAQAGVRGARGLALQQLGARAWGAAGARACGAGTQQARRHDMDVRECAAGAGRGARGGRLGGLCVSGVLSWARLGVLVHLTKFLAWFDSVFS